MEFIFISPHLDDIALSCGGIVHNLSKNQNNVQIWTIFAGDPPLKNFPEFALSLHNRWNLDVDVVKIRREEDIIACNILGANAVHFSYPDCIYRKLKNGQPLVQKEEDLYRSIAGNQESLVKEIHQKLFLNLNQDQILVVPFSIGNHIDHQIVRNSINFFKNKTIYYYADYPYNIKSPQEEKKLIGNNFHKKNFPLDKDDIKAWHQSVAAYKSQLSTFWPDENQMIKEIENYAKVGGGNNLWFSLQ